MSAGAFYDHGLTPTQIEALLAPLHPGRIRQAQGNSHLEAWDVRRHLLRVFGWGGWDFTVLSAELVSERSAWDESNPLKGRHTVVYRVLARLTIKDPQGVVLAHFDDGATGDAANQPSLGDAHDMALKTAMSQALKRCAVNCGDRFGLSLYSKNGESAVVGNTLARPVPTTVATSEDVTEGELEGDDVTVLEWLSVVLPACKDEDDLRAAWTGLTTLVVAGQVREGDRSRLEKAWLDRKDALLAAPSDGADPAPSEGWPDVKQPGAAA